MCHSVQLKHESELKLSEMMFKHYFFLFVLKDWTSLHFIAVNFFTFCCLFHRQTQNLTAAQKI